MRGKKRQEIVSTEDSESNESFVIRDDFDDASSGFSGATKGPAPVDWFGSLRRSSAGETTAKRVKETTTSRLFNGSSVPPSRKPKGAKSRENVPDKERVSDEPPKSSFAKEISDSADSRNVRADSQESVKMRSLLLGDAKTVPDVDGTANDSKSTSAYKVKSLLKRKVSPEDSDLNASGEFEVKSGGARRKPPKKRKKVTDAQECAEDGEGESAPASALKKSVSGILKYFSVQEKVEKLPSRPASSPVFAGTRITVEAIVHDEPLSPPVKSPTADAPRTENNEQHSRLSEPTEVDEITVVGTMSACESEVSILPMSRKLTEMVERSHGAPEAREEREGEKFIKVVKTRSTRKDAKVHSYGKAAAKVKKSGGVPKTSRLEIDDLESPAEKSTEKVNESEEDGNRRRSSRLASKAVQRVDLSGSSRASSPGSESVESKDSSESVRSVEVVTVKKLAPLFLPRAKKQAPLPKPGLSEAAIEARQNFLSSGLPEEVVKKAAKITDRDVLEEACLPSSENCHVGCSRDLLFDVPKLANDVRKLLNPQDSVEVSSAVWSSPTPLPKPWKSSRSPREQEQVITVEDHDDESSVSLWTERPFTKIVGNDQAMKRIGTWLSRWSTERNRGKPAKIRRKRRGDILSDEEDFEDHETDPSVLVLCGPPGVGKTSAVHFFAQRLDLSVLEVNCSSRRSGKLVLNQMREATRSHQLQQDSGAAPSACVVLLDDVDVVFDGEDDGFLSAVSVFASETKRPIVLTTTNPSAARIDGCSDSVVVELEPVETSVLAAHLRTFVEQDGDRRCLLDEGDALELAEFCRGDVRRSLNEMQAFVWSLPDRERFERIVPGILLGSESLNLKEDGELPVLGLFHRNVPSLSGLVGVRKNDAVEKNDFWTVLEAEVDEVGDAASDVKLDSSLFSASDDEDNEDTEISIGTAAAKNKRKDCGEVKAENSDATGRDVESSGSRSNLRRTSVSEKLKTRVRALSLLSDSIAHQDSFCALAGLSGNEWPVWNGVWLDHGLSDEWSASSQDACAPALSTAILSFVERGDVLRVCAMLSDRSQSAGGGDDPGSSEGADDSHLFDLLSRTCNGRTVFQVWDSSVEQRRREMAIQSSYAGCLDRVPLHRTLNRSSFGCDFMPGLRQVIRNDVRAGKLRGRRRQRRRNSRSLSLTTQYLSRLNYVFDDDFIRRACNDFFQL